jgi:hypothetical protein
MPYSASFERSHQFKFQKNAEFPATQIEEEIVSEEKLGKRHVPE